MIAIQTRRVRKNWRYFFIFGFYHMRPLFPRSPQRSTFHFSSTDSEKLGAKWKIWTLSFQGYAIIFCSWSGLVTALCQSQVVLGAFQKMAWFASAENLVFALFFSKCCHLEHNEYNHLKPTSNVTYFPKSLWEEKNLLISLAAFELLKFEKWPQVVLRKHNFGEESSPVLSYSTPGQ